MLPRFKVWRSLPATASISPLSTQSSSVAFAGECEVAHIVEIVDGDNAADGKYGPQMGAFV